MSLSLRNAFHNMDLASVMQDLLVRFVINCPPEDLASSERLFFQLEEAQWFYEDFIRVENPSLPSMKLKTFIEKMFQACPILRLYSQDMESDLNKFQSYKSVIPVRGAIILNKKMTKAVMVKGWKSGASWGFPKGKINKDERDDLCAVREVYEEIGYDISPFIVQEDYLEVTIKQKNIRLYIVRGIPGNTVFTPQTRKEISKIEWHDVKSLPAFSKNSSNTAKSGEYYYMVAPFMSGLAKYIAKAKGYASNLSKSETRALKNLLGVQPAREAINGVSAAVNGGDVASSLLSSLTSQVNERGPSFASGTSAGTEIITDSDQAAKHLLSLVKSGPISKEETADANTASPSDRKILLDLLNGGKSPDSVPQTEEHQLNSAKEILKLLKNEMDQSQLVQQPLVTPALPLYAPPMPQSMQFMYPPPPLPPFAHPGQPAFVPQGPPAPLQFFQQQQQQPVQPAGIPSSLQNSTGSSHQSVSQPPPPPPPPNTRPNTMLMSLLSSKRNSLGAPGAASTSGAGVIGQKPTSSGPSTPMPSMKGGKNALLSLLETPKKGGSDKVESPPPAQTASQTEPRLQHHETPLKSTESAGDTSSSALLNLLWNKPPTSASRQELPHQLQQRTRPEEAIKLKDLFDRTGVNPASPLNNEPTSSNDIGSSSNIFAEPRSITPSSQSQISLFGLFSPKQQQQQQPDAGTSPLPEASSKPIDETKLKNFLETFAIGGY